MLKLSLEVESNAKSDAKVGTLFQILTLCKKMLAPIKALVIEFYFIYKPKAKNGMVGGRKIIVNAQVLNEVMHLPISKIEIENFKNNSAKHESHFKCQEKSKTPTIG